MASNVLIVLATPKYIAVILFDPGRQHPGGGARHRWFAGRKRENRHGMTGDVAAAGAGAQPPDGLTPTRNPVRRMRTRCDTYARQLHPFSARRLSCGRVSVKLILLKHITRIQITVPLIGYCKKNRRELR